jgi:hypothetical protein
MPIMIREIRLEIIIASLKMELPKKYQFGGYKWDIKKHHQKL